MRVFTNGTAFITNPVWHAALGAEAHIRQFSMMLVAPTKNAATELLLAMGLSEGAAQSLVKEARATTVLGRDWQMPVSENAIDLDEAGLYLSGGGREDERVVRVVSTTEVEIVGEFGYEPPARGRGLFFTPARRTSAGR